ncbi:bifunctional DNA-formamidopyrimidine glycosylase/DNA-(apurinic or apyrimidinic site) lyase [Robiginitomaculum antarcticum]|uniref:bifunctional DNA-formamidopyrimidine glycosylase/DNA-(apurinic or apyrimidinic site) lyase n=1 Tax=Robiginitomaculum antarcticum TaxID=437507 RepID=UPI00036BFAA6|nr:bifunctional DNA-formamidopyrimidine glycosylase/DNA-(apurinic or apyrimidinic site) lyase [Robiginitomaculum antarcticum]
MPELPEVETVRAGLSPFMEGVKFERVTLNRPDLRFPFADNFTARLEGATIDRLLRRAKFLMAELSTGETLLLHLGMSGRFTIDEGGASLTPGQFTHPQTTNPKHDHVVFDMAAVNGKAGARIVFNDPRRFGFMELFGKGEAIERLAHLGPEPLSNSFNGPVLRAAFKGKKSKIKTALLDQRNVAGLGNIYVCEALYRAGISPRRAAGRLSVGEGESLAGHIKAVLRDAIASGGSTLRDFAGASGELGYFQHSFDVYGREGEPCKSCGAAVVRLAQSARSTFYCRACQR